MGLLIQAHCAIMVKLALLLALAALCVAANASILPTTPGIVSWSSAGPLKAPHVVEYSANILRELDGLFAEHQVHIIYSVNNEIPLASWRTVLPLLSGATETAIVSFPDAQSGNAALTQFLEQSDMRDDPVVVQPSNHPIRKDFPAKYVIDFVDLDIEFIREAEALLEGVPHVSTIFSRGLRKSEKLTKRFNEDSVRVAVRGVEHMRRAVEEDDTEYSSEWPPAVVEGLLLGAILVIIAVVGFWVTMNIQTPERFEAPVNARAQKA